MTTSEHPGRTLRNLMEAGTVMCPGAFNALVARAVARAGFPAIYISGGATANGSGYPDIGLLSLPEMCRTIREISSAGGLPVVVDADTGYGEGEMVRRTVIEYVSAGAAGLHLEDQVFPKRCGHLDGKTLVPAEDMIEKVKIAVATRDELGGDPIIIARTDAASVAGIEEAIERGQRYREAGADVIFPEGLTSPEEFNRFAEDCPGWLLANMTEFGKTPVISVDQFASLGYDLVIYPITLQRVAMAAVCRALVQLAEDGSVSAFVDDMQTRQELYQLLDYVPGVPWSMPPRKGRITS